MPPSRQARAASDMPLPRRKARGSRLSGQRIARAFHRINFIMISEKKWGRPCRYHVEEGLPQECPYPSAYRGCASFSFSRHCIILKKAVAFRHRRIPDAKRPHTEKRRALCIDSRRSRPVPQRPCRAAHRHPGPRPDGRGRGGDGLAGIRLAQSLRPDLILLDISMPELSGVEAIPRIREVAPEARILIVSMHATAGRVRAALKAGADGYLLKTADEDEFLVAIRALLREGTSALSHRVHDYFIRGRQRRSRLESRLPDAKGKNGAETHLPRATATKISPPS